jgi:S-adenosylmethionine:tRNA ribosyltransferase-isomerase
MVALSVDLFSLEAYDYTLPKSLVAAYPLQQRDASRLLHVDRALDCCTHKAFTDLVSWLQPNDVLVINNTKVLPARLVGCRAGFTGRAEVLLLHPVANQAGARSAEDPTLVWHCLMKPSRKLSIGTRIELPNTQSYLEVIERNEEGYGVVKLHLAEHQTPLSLMQTVGEMPIPPYFERNAEALDKERYQTVYSQVEGSQAAPTAGLHFTEATLEAIKAKGVVVAPVTLSVGTGTFKPVTVSDIREHVMHSEAYSVPQSTVEAIQHAKAMGGRVVAVGTTSLKTLETVAKNQNGQLAQAEEGWSNLFIYPGFEFKVVDALLTNFHLPKSTLMMLVSAFANRSLVLQAYEQAVAEQYRFYSYGDCMLIS